VTSHSVELTPPHEILTQILLEGYGVSEPAAYVPQAVPWDCQQPADRDGGQWAVVSANYMVDSGNCVWLLQYPHQVLAGGSMYAVQLPDVIPAAGQPDGPQLPADYHYFAGMHRGDVNPRSIFLNCIRDPQQLQPTMDHMQAMMENYRKKK
jgi:hypothetical protein